MEIDILKRIIAEVMKVDPNEIKNNTTFVDGLGADSLDLCRIVMRMEEQFNVVLPKDTLYNINNLDDAVLVIRRAKNL